MGSSPSKPRAQRLDIFLVAVSLLSAFWSTSSAAASKEEEQLQVQRLRAAIAAKTLISAAKIPDSVSFTSVFATDSGFICYVFRARNSFNAPLRLRSVLTAKGVLLTQERNGDAFVRAWKKQCSDAPGYDITGSVNMMIGGSLF